MDKLVKKIVFRVDSGNHVGIGHTMRCLTLAQELKKYNYEIHFITKNHIGYIHKPITEDFHLFILENGIQKILSPEEILDYKNWIGQSLENDLAMTNEYLKKISQVDLFIVDHYSIGSSYEEKVFANKVMAIDDLMDRNHFCDLLLDQNITAQIDVYEKFMKKSNALCLVGPRFALLREDFRVQRAQIDDKKFDRPVKNILVFFGGADSNGVTLKLAKSLKTEFLERYKFTFILNSNHKDYNTLYEFQKNHSQVELLSFVKNFGEIIGEVDLFIGAGGTTSWERACLGVASALVSVADNQLKNCVELQRTNNIYFLGLAQSMTVESWSYFFSQIVPDDSLWYNIRKNSFQLVDGLGAKRVADSIRQVLSC